MAEVWRILTFHRTAGCSAGPDVLFGKHCAIRDHLWEIPIGLTVTKQQRAYLPMRTRAMALCTFPVMPPIGLFEISTAVSQSLLLVWRESFQSPLVSPLLQNATAENKFGVQLPVLALISVYHTFTSVV